MLAKYLQYIYDMVVIESCERKIAGGAEGDARGTTPTYIHLVQREMSGEWEAVTESMYHWKGKRGYIQLVGVECLLGQDTLQKKNNNEKEK